jgi:hypothetical protein
MWRRPVYEMSGNDSGNISGKKIGNSLSAVRHRRSIQGHISR